MQAVNGEATGLQLDGSALAAGAQYRVCYTMSTTTCLASAPAQSYTQCMPIVTAAPPEGGTFSSAALSATELVDQATFFADGWDDGIVLHQLGAYLDVGLEPVFVPLTTFRPAQFTQFAVSIPGVAQQFVLRVVNVAGAWRDVPLEGSLATRALDPEAVIAAIDEQLMADLGGQLLTTALLVASTTESTNTTQAELQSSQLSVLEALLARGFGATEGRGYHPAQVRSQISFSHPHHTVCSVLTQQHPCVGRQCSQPARAAVFHPEPPRPAL